MRAFVRRYLRCSCIDVFVPISLDQCARSHAPPCTKGAISPPEKICIFGATRTDKMHHARIRLPWDYFAGRPNQFPHAAKQRIRFTRQMYPLFVRKYTTNRYNTIARLFDFAAWSVCFSLRETNDAIRDYSDITGTHCCSMSMAFCSTCSSSSS